MQKIRMKIGNCEFEAEGDQQVVDEHLKHFVDLVNKTPVSTKESLKQTPREENPPNGDPPENGDGGDNSDRPSDDLIRKTFSTDKDLVSLRILPRTKSYAADSLLLILYGYYLLKGQTDVLGGHLLKAAKQSGLQVDRVGRVLMPHRGYYNEGGVRKGARYGLNNRGHVKARELLEQLYA